MHFFYKRISKTSLITFQSNINMFTKTMTMVKGAKLKPLKQFLTWQHKGDK